MKRKLTALIALALIVAALLSSCGKAPDPELLKGCRFLFSDPNSKAQFSISLERDGTYSYFEGVDTEYIGVGRWTVEGKRICLTDTYVDSKIVNYFTHEDGNLVYSEKGSTGFPNSEIENGTVFDFVIRFDTGTNDDSFLDPEG